MSGRKTCSKLLANGVEHTFETVKVANSTYVDFEVDGQNKLSFEIIF
jgi:hypothetical protein